MGIRASHTQSVMATLLVEARACGLPSVTRLIHHNPILLVCVSLMREANYSAFELNSTNRAGCPQITLLPMVSSYLVGMLQNIAILPDVRCLH